MIIQIIVVTLATVVVANLALVISTMIKTHLAFERIKKQSRGLKSCVNFSLITGHLKETTFKRNSNMELVGMHEKNGKTFLVMFGARPACSSIDLELIKYIAQDEIHLHCQRFDTSGPMEEFFVDNIFLTRNWRPIRKAMAPMLRPSNFKTANVSKEINNSIGKLIEAIECKLNSQSKPISLNVTDYCHRYSINLTLNCFYKQDNLIDFHASKDEMVDVIQRGLAGLFDNPLVPYTLVFTYLNPLIDWFIWHFTKIGTWRKRVIEFIRLQTELNLEAKRQMISQNEENISLKDGRTYNRNMIDYFIDQFVLGKITRRQYFHSAVFLFAASDKTSGDTLANVLYNLALHEEKQEKLRRDVELRGHESEYLLWCINESLRLHPPVPLGCSRTLERDVEIEGGRYLVPSGTYVLTAVYVIHRLKEYWGADAGEFRPERFGQQKSFHPCQFMPFGAGLRQCPGKEFALHELKMVLVELLKRFKFSAKPKRNEAFNSPFSIITIPEEETILSVSRVID